MKYELFFLVGESKESNLEKISEEIKKVVTQEGGNFLEPQITEKRKMAYRIEGEVRGTYIAQRFELTDTDKEGAEEKNQIDSITKKLNLNQNILRFMIVKADELLELKSRKEIVREKRIDEKKVSKPREIKKEEKKPEPTGDIDEKLEEILKI